MQLFFDNLNIQIKSNQNQIFIILVWVPVRCSELAEPDVCQSTQCKIASVAICVNLTNSGFEPNLLRHKARTSTTRSPGVFAQIVNTLVLPRKLR